MSIQFHNQTMNIWEDFEDSTLYTGLTKVDTGSLWTIPSTDYFKNGTASGKLTYTGMSAATYIYNAPNVTNGSFGFWVRTPSIAQYTSGVQIGVVYNSSYAEPLRMYFTAVSGTNYQLRFYNGTAESLYTVSTFAAYSPQWLWITVQYNSGGTIYFNVYNASNTLLFSSSLSDVVGGGFYEVAIGAADTAYASSGTIAYFDDFVIDSTNKLFPILGWDTSSGSIPVIYSVTPSAFVNGQTGIIASGTNFSSTGNAIFVGSLANGSGTNVTQTISTQSNNSINMTAVQGALSLGGNYVFVTNASGSTNTTGYPIYLTTNPTYPTKTIVVGGQGTRASCSDLNGGAYGSGQTYTSMQGTNGAAISTITGCTYSTASGTLTKVGSFSPSYKGLWVNTVNGGSGTWSSKRYYVNDAGTDYLNIGAGLGNTTNAINVYVGGALNDFYTAESIATTGDTLTGTYPNGSTYTTVSGASVTLYIPTGSGSGLLYANKRGNKQ
jgi:hypothetical protein